MCSAGRIKHIHDYFSPFFWHLNTDELLLRKIGVLSVAHDDFRLVALLGMLGLVIILLDRIIILKLAKCPLNVGLLRFLQYREVLAKLRLRVIVHLQLL